jgi:excisionase family DNA binding protein
MLKAEILQEIRTLIITAPPKIPQRQWLKTWEVKEMLGVSLSTLRNMRKNGKIEYTKVGGLLLYNYHHIMQLIEKNKKNIKKPIK